MNNTVKILLIAIIPLGIIAVLFFNFNSRRGNNNELPAINTLPEFSLLTQDSTRFTQEQLRDRITIADFIFTTCGGPCPLMTAKMRELQDTFAVTKDVHFLSFSVDPEFDTPSVLKEYAKHFTADTRQWTFLTGEKKRIYGLALKGFFLPVEDEEQAILHSTKFILIDGEGTIRGYYDYNDSTAIPKLIHDTNLLLESL